MHQILKTIQITLLRRGWGGWSSWSNNAQSELHGPEVKSQTAHIYVILSD